MSKYTSAKAIVSDEFHPDYDQSKKALQKARKAQRKLKNNFRNYEN